MTTHHQNPQGDEAQKQRKIVSLFLSLQEKNSNSLDIRAHIFTDKMKNHVMITYSSYQHYTERKYVFFSLDPFYPLRGTENSQH